MLPIMPPRVHQAWVAGSGPKVSPWRSAARRRSSRTTPGSARATRRSGSISTIRVMWRDMSSTTASLHACPARLVPAPRARSAAPASAASRAAARTSSWSAGNTTPTTRPPARGVAPLPALGTVPAYEPYRDRTSCAMSSPASVGFCATLAPAPASASILAWAVPLFPEMMAPAWPIRRPGGAVTPAM